MTTYQVYFSRKPSGPAKVNDWFKVEATGMNEAVWMAKETIKANMANPDEVRIVNVEKVSRI